MINVHYFASIRESLGRAHEELPSGAGTTTAGGVMDTLIALHGAQWHRVLREGRVLMAVNQAVARADSVVRDGDEIAFFPPVTGG